MKSANIDYAHSMAILIGTSRYNDSEFPDVPAVENSLHGMRSALTDPNLGGWPEDRVKFWLNAQKGPQLAISLRRLARSTRDVLFFYFVGHGSITTREELCLILTDSEYENPDLTGLEYESVRRALIDSPALTKIVVLDCCYSNRAIPKQAPTLSANNVSNIVRTEGTYTLTATNASDQLARVSAFADQNDNATSFTRELLELVYHGVEDGPENLTFNDIFPLLCTRLTSRDLPEPKCTSTNTANHFIFSRNVSYSTINTGSLDRPQIVIPPRSKPKRVRHVGPWISRREILIMTGAAVAGGAAAGTYAALQPDATHASASDKPAAILLGTAETSHTAGVWQVAAGQLGNRPIAVSSGGDHQILLWDLVQRRRLGNAMRGHRAGVRGLATSTVNGRLIAISGSDDTTLRIWDLATQKEVGAPLTGHTSLVRGIATAVAKGRQVAVSASLDKTARVWDLASRVEVGPILPHPAKVHNVATGILNGVPIAVTGAEDSTARVWSLETHKQIDVAMVVPGPPPETVEAVAVGSVGGQPIAVTGGSDRYVRLWSLENGQPLSSPLGRQTDWVWGTAIGSLRGDAIAVSVGDGTGRVWNLTQGGNLQTTLGGLPDSVWGVALTKLNEHTIALTGCLDGRVRLWDLGTA